MRWLLPGILVQKDKEVQLAANSFGNGRSVYISGLPYSFENRRILYCAILWASQDEEILHKWFSTNNNVEVHAFVANGKYCVVNNTYVPQNTVVYTDNGALSCTWVPTRSIGMICKNISVSSVIW